jgi:hypothetical protein
LPICAERNDYHHDGDHRGEENLHRVKSFTRRILEEVHDSLTQEIGTGPALAMCRWPNAAPSDKSRLAAGAANLNNFIGMENLVDGRSSQCLEL